MNTNNTVLWENEVKANKIMANAIYVTIGVIAILLVLVEFEVFYLPDRSYRLMIGFNISIMLICNIVAMKFKFSRGWIKYMMMATLIIVYAGLDSMFTFYVPVLIVIPMVISSRYFSKRYTMIIAAVSMVVFSVSAIYGANHGQLDLNSLEIPKTDVIATRGETWLSDIFEGVKYDKSLMIKNVLMYSFSIRFLLSLIVVSVVIRIAGQGRELIYKQQELTEKTVRVNTELEMASNIQSSMLPRLFPAFPDRKEFDLYALMKPAKEVGGDFYDFFMLDDDHIALVVADVSGKGVPAALFMMISKIIIKARAQSGDVSPKRILLETNESIYRNNEENMFVTVWLGVLEISTGKLTYADAGHEKMVLYHDGEWSFMSKKYNGVALGMFENEDIFMLKEKSQIVDQEVNLNKGDVIFQYTDGVTEAKDDADELFGETRLLEACRCAEDKNPEQLLPHIERKIKGFIKDAPQYDDVTMLGLRYNGL